MKLSFRIIFSYLPLSDLLYLWLGMRFTLVRLPRLLKVGAYTELLYRLDAVLSRPYIIRILRVNACRFL